MGAQQAAELVATWRSESNFLFETKGAASDGERLAVLTAPTPAIHIFDGVGVDAWGRVGRGPAELTSPVARSDGAHAHVGHAR